MDRIVWRFANALTATAEKVDGRNSRRKMSKWLKDVTDFTTESHQSLADTAAAATFNDRFGHIHWASNCTRTLKWYTLLSMRELYFAVTYRNDPLCTLRTGLDLLVVSVRRRLPLHDDVGTNSFRATWMAQRNFMAQHGSQLGHIWSVNLAGGYVVHDTVQQIVHDFLLVFNVNYTMCVFVIF